MAKAYQISNNIIFCINDDGSITKLAKIDASGNVCSLGGNKLGQNKSGLWVIIALLIICSVVFGVLYINAKNEYVEQSIQLQSIQSKYDDTQSMYQNAQSMYENAQSTIYNLEQEKITAENNLNDFKQTVGDAYPMIISDLEIANAYYNGSIETDYGYTIYSRNTMYLMPRIKYYGISSGNKTLKVKWYGPDGSLRTGISSPSGYTYTTNDYIYSGADNSLTLSGWGNESKGNWRSGKYRIEIWYDNICLRSKDFYIH